MIKPSSSPIALKTFITSDIGDFVISSGGSSSVGPSGDPSIPLSVLGAGSASTSSSPDTSISSPSSSEPCGCSPPCACSFKDFLEPIIDSLTNSPISCFMVEASIPFAFSLIASSIVFICNKASSTNDSDFLLLI